MLEYYSQYKQDEFLNKVVFKGKTDGVFVDIGANDGISFSNTYFFEKELKWTGVCFEPLESAFQKLQANRTSINIKACASNEDKFDFFLSISGYGEMLSGLKSKYDVRHLQRVYTTIKEYGGTIEEIEIKCIDINKVLESNLIKNVDFISIDTEGNELEILKTINFEKIHVKAITVENNYQSPDFNDFLITKGFIKIKTLVTDELYVNRADFSFLKRFFMAYLFDIKNG